VSEVFTTVIKKVIGTKNERVLKKLQPLVEEINSLEPTLEKLNDNELKAKTGEFKERIEKGESLDAILPEAFAVVREVARRTLNMRHFDCQLVGGTVLHQGKIAEMATGEGKTLVATLPAYLNALTGKGVHIITVNDYLAKRDRAWMGVIYEFLGLTVDVIYHDIDLIAKREAYEADITYGTNTEFGFDYLRDNMARVKEEQVQRPHYYAIVDEVDSILIDEARTPLIISGPVEYSTHQFKQLKSPVQRLVQSQTTFVNKLLAQAEQLFKDENEYEGAIKLLQAKRGSPKNKRFLKMAKEGKHKKLIEKVELDYIRDKRVGELDEELYFSIDEKSHVVDLTDKGREALAPQDPNLFVLPDLSVIDEDPNISDEEKNKKRRKMEKEFSDKGEKIQNISQLLKAYSLFEKDIEYVVSDGQVLIVDEFTGRLLPGRRYSDGLHQALEAKEGVTIEGETQTFATITIQNYFRLYDKLAGMTGTAETEAPEFMKIYKLEVDVIPTNEPVRRINYPDVIYQTKREKYRAIIDEIKEMHEKERPVLVGTVSVEVSELLSRMIPKTIKHSVLNAKRHQEEAEIIENAGMAGAVTIATNMAGRGTDIKLGPGVVKCKHCCVICEVKKTKGCSACPDPDKKGEIMTECSADMPCGLHILGTERHDSRRIDRQLRGRCARQGDPGSSRFYLSLEDNLLRIFGSERISSIMERLDMQEGERIEHKLLTSAIERAQARVEGHNFDIRKHLLEYDDVMNKQREVIYQQRNKVLNEESLKDEVTTAIEELAEGIAQRYAEEKVPPDEWDIKGLKESVLKQFSFPLYLTPDVIEDLTYEKLLDLIERQGKEVYKRKETEFGEDALRQLEKFVYLQMIDTLWKEHLLNMDHMKEGIGLRAHAQKDPLREYQKEGYDMFTDLVNRISSEVIEKLYMVQLAQEPQQQMQPAPSGPQQFVLSRGDAEAQAQPSKGKTVKREGKKVGRNEPCPCGSGKKYKKCCGR
jgi:preprotein translocase subunit SecA